MPKIAGSKASMKARLTTESSGLTPPKPIRGPMNQIRIPMISAPTRAKNGLERNILRTSFMVGPPLGRRLSLNLGQENLDAAILFAPLRRGIGGDRVRIGFAHGGQPLGIGHLGRHDRLHRLGAR